jgi:hypothetical protein
MVASGHIDNAFSAWLHMVLSLAHLPITSFEDFKVQ